jgi:hypothetical protein
MRAIYVAALIVFSAAALSLSYEPPAHGANHRANLLLAQNGAGAQNAPAAHAPSDKSQAKQNPNGTKQKPDGSAKSADPNAQQPSTTPWLGAPPQFQRTWPPTPLPQQDDNDDLLLLLAPRHPPKVHKA